MNQKHYTLNEIIDFFNPEINLGYLGSVEIKISRALYLLTVKKRRWMTYDPVLKNSVKEIYSHYDIAYGNVICTGLGLGIREQLLLTKPEVEKITVLEKSLDLINFHKKYSNWAKNDKINFINTDAGNYKGSCDTLLLDHYEQQNAMAVLNNVKSITKNIKCNTLWFWPCEKYIKQLGFDYDTFKNIYNLNELPILSKDKLEAYCSAFYTR